MVGRYTRIPGAGEHHHHTTVIVPGGIYGGAYSPYNQFGTVNYGQGYFDINNYNNRSGPPSVNNYQHTAPVAKPAPIAQRPQPPAIDKDAADSALTTRDQLDDNKDLNAAQKKIVTDTVYKSQAEPTGFWATVMSFISNIGDMISSWFGGHPEESRALAKAGKAYEGLKQLQGSGYKIDAEALSGVEPDGKGGYQAHLDDKGQTTGIYARTVMRKDHPEMITVANELRKQKDKTENAEQAKIDSDINRPHNTIGTTRMLALAEEMKANGSSKASIEDAFKKGLGDAARSATNDLPREQRTLMQLSMAAYVDQTSRDMASQYEKPEFLAMSKADQIQALNIIAENNAMATQGKSTAIAYKNTRLSEVAGNVIGPLNYDITGALTDYQAYQEQANADIRDKVFADIDKKQLELMKQQGIRHDTNNTPPAPRATPNALAMGGPQGKDTSGQGKAG